MQTNNARGYAIFDGFLVIYQTQRINWIKRYLDPNISHPWKVLLSKRIMNIGGSIVFKCNYCTSLLNADLSPFYIECFKTWSDLNDQDERPNIDQYDKHILIGEGINFLHKTEEIGVNFIYDLYTGNGDLIKWVE